jgi:hypothetical protein
MNGQQTLLDASADSRCVDARIEIEDTAILAGFPFAMHGSSEVSRRRPMSAEDQLSVLNSHFHALLVNAGHLNLERKSVGILMKVHERREILHALSGFTLSL